MQASLPPQIIAVAEPKTIARYASPMDVADDAQAVVWSMLGPLA